MAREAVLGSVSMLRGVAIGRFLGPLPSKAPVRQ